MPYVRWLCLSFFLLAVSVLEIASADEALIKRFMAEAPDAWKRLDEMYSRVHVRFKERHFVPADGTGVQVQKEEELDYSYNGLFRRRHLFTTSRDGRPHEQVAIRRAEEYLFYAERYGSDKPFVLTDVVPGPPAPDERLVPPALLAPHEITYLDLAKLIKTNSFRITSADMVEGADAPLVRIQFVHSGPNDRFESGWAELDPDKYWVLRRYRVKRPVGDERLVTIRYGQEAANGFLPIEEIQIKGLPKGAPDNAESRIREEVVFSKFEQADIPESEFSFQAVGLPELSFGRSRFWLWIGMLGVLMLILGSVISAYRGRVLHTAAGRTHTGP